MSRLIVVSNRVSIPDQRDKGAAGGLAVAMFAALRRYQGIWFGWSGRIVESATSEVSQTRLGAATVATIDLTQEDYEEYYNGFANRALWPLFHYRPDLTAYDRKYDRGYFRVNARFAHSLAPLLQEGDLIWVHDYHLFACGEELRRMGCRQRMGFFLHIPFPASEVLLTLPNHANLVRGLFAYDLVGLQRASDLRNLQDYVVHEAGGTLHPDGRLSAYGRTIRTDVFPIGLDTDDFLEMTHSEQAQRFYERIRQSMGRRQLVIGVDRLDYTKGLPERLSAFERLLEAHPEHCGAVSMLQVAPPSRLGVPEYEDIRHEIEVAIGRINGRFADFDWVPIRYVSRGYPRSALAGLYRFSRIGLVTPFRDGMNLVAKEYVAAQAPEDPGVLVLSRFAGAADQLDGAVIVNPYDMDGVVEGMQKGLKLPREERRERWKSMIACIRRDDVLHWRDHFVTALRGEGAPRLPHT